MRKSIALVAALIIGAILTTSVAVFAGVENKDPIKMLEQRKANVRQELSEGKITKEEADNKIARIDKKIKDIQEFNKLPLKEKKEKLINSFTARVDKKVQEGELTRDNADKMISKFKAKVEKWDGNGYPFHFKGLKGEKRGHKGDRKGQ